MYAVEFVINDYLWGAVESVRSNRVTVSVIQSVRRNESTAVESVRKGL
jgi:hypothetical protein